MKSKPFIGVMPLIDYSKDSYWMLPGYINGLKAAGSVPLVLPLMDNINDIRGIMDICDGFLFTGGQDIAPSLYGEEKMSICGDCSPERDIMEKLILDEALKRDKPVLGICRGIQFINAYLGGTLWQNIPTQFSDMITHCQKPPYDVPVHNVEIVKDTPLHTLLKKDSISVNSYHHQGIRELSSKLKCMAVSPDGLIEAVYAPDKRFVWAVQWHPEFFYEKDENSRLILAEFARNCQSIRSF